MSVSGAYFITEEFLSPARFNRKCNTHLPGDQISVLSPTYPNQIVICNQTVGGHPFTVDTMYMRNSANTGWIGGSGGQHLHDQATDAAGGLLSAILYANLTKVIWENDVYPNVGKYVIQSSGGGSATDVPPEMRLSTGTTNGAWVHVSKFGVGLSFASNSRFVIRMAVSHNSNITARLGVLTEGAADTGDQPSRKYGMEVCDSAGTARNWDVLSADGTTRTATSSSIDVASASQKAYRLDYTVASKIEFFVDGAASPSLTKTSNVPAGGTVTGGRPLGAGVKTNNTTGKTMNITGLAFAGVPAAVAWG